MFQTILQIKAINQALDLRDVPQYKTIELCTETVKIYRRPKEKKNSILPKSNRRNKTK